MGSLGGGDLVVGVGLRDGVGPDAVLDAISAVVDDPTELHALATLERKATESSVAIAAAELGVPVLGYTADELAAVHVPSPSGRVADAVGTPSVAEAAAVLGSGGGDLVVRKRARDGVTVALARTVW
ncbi:cobalamin biosynthesis protein [Rhodococcus spelaei]|uniref:Cobalamin biosynthesis protein n=1 Tax=Rhodococcus spelaei TaxID=2546320 RepID=A0A541B410_9NOCA|nr:cobalamin biosynthesis protein [Rhodococcus spelaei]TQF67044.1 cobalamin biosynthesis protein [Rhodococcus spelaei]